MADLEYVAHSFLPSQSRPAPSATDASLRAQFETLFPPDKSDFVPSRITAGQVVQAVFPLIFRRTLRSVPDLYLAEISEIVSSATKSGSTSSLSEEEARRHATVLGHCWTRSAPSTIANADPGDFADRVANNYADFIRRRAIHLKNEVERLTGLLGLLESTISRFAKTSNDRPLPISVSAAWALLRSKLNIIEPVGIHVDLPAQERIRTYLQEKLEILGEDVGSYDLSMEGMISKEGAVDDGPTSEHAVLTRNQIDKRIKRLQADNDHKGLNALWTQVRESLTSESSVLPPSEKDEILSLLLRSLKRPLSPAQPSERLFQEVLSVIQRPLSRVIATTLLALRARPDGHSLRAGHEVISLDDHPTINANSKMSSGDDLNNLKSTWKECGEKDLKMYMIYIEGLGRLGDLDGLKETWNEMVKDKRCKDLYLAQENSPLSTSFPPIAALNQMISACLLIPSTGPDTALDLFNQACLPTSTVSINLITINTVLRHHARRADLSSMSALFSLAEKSGLKPDVVTYTTLVQGLLRAGRLMLAKKVLEDMHQQGISPNERMSSMLIADLAKSGTKIGLAHAEEILKLMRQKQMKTNEVTWTGLIAGYFRGGWEVDAWDAVKRMNRAGLRLNRVGYNMLLRESGKGGGRTGILKLWKNMLEDGVSPNSDTYLLALTPLVLEKRWNEAEEVLLEMDKRRFKPEKGALASIVAKARSRR
ncbi:hypothetical protein I317_00284 [Kwoniella heveanensis CBS 569]|nr:hypothetical protein I317_00284 [Kwoniella heveanensis CBS 569]